MEFKIGDKVRVINMDNAPKAYGDMTNKIGIIKWNAPSEWDNKKYGIAFEDVKNHSSEKGYFYFFKDNLELICNNIPTLLEIKENNLRCVIKVDSKEEAMKLFEIFNPNDYDANYSYNYLMFNYRKGDETVCFSVVGNKINGFDTETSYKKYEEQYGKIYRFSDLFATGGFCDGFRGGKIPTPSKPVSIEEQLGLPKGVSIHDLPTSELIKKEFNVAWIDKITLPTATETKEMVERVRREILKFTNAFPKEDKKLKFTFYVKEGTRPDKKCNGTIPTITTNIELFDGNVFDKVTTIRGSATCDKADYDERQGVLEALANAVCGGEFEKRYSKAVKANKDADLIMRTCTYCGKVCDTSEEKIEHEAWHVERKKARRERYLLRKRAKEIAFEEQAQKMAKEMMGEQK